MTLQAFPFLYQGNGITERFISFDPTGLGLGVAFTPQVVIISGRTGGYPAFIKTSAMPNNVSFSLTGSQLSDGILSMEPGGFRIGAGTVNDPADSYVGIALCDEDGDFLDVGTYVGNSADDRNIALGWGANTPDVVFVIRSGVTAVWRSSDFTGDDSQQLDAAAAANLIQAFASGSFQVGNNNAVNLTGFDYYWIALRDTAIFSTLTYTGNGVDNRNLTGLGFNPDSLAFVKRDDSVAPAVLKFAPQTGDDSIPFDSGEEQPDMIQSFVTDGIQVGTDANVNADTITYRGFAVQASWVVTDFILAEADINAEAPDVEFIANSWIEIDGGEALATIRAEADGEFVEAINATFTINYEVLSNAAEAGVPGAALSLVGAQLSRLRADLYDWEVVLNPAKKRGTIGGWPALRLRAANLADEFLGPKVGTGPIMSFTGWDYEWLLDGVGPWTARIPTTDPNLLPALDGTAKIIRFYLEGIGPILTGWIASHEVDEEGVCTLTGYDLGVFLTRRSSFYRHVLDRAWGWQMYDQACAMLTPATYTLEFGPNAGQDPGTISGSPEHPENYFQTRRFASQTIVEMFQEVNQIWGTHWRINPIHPRIYIDEMGVDSGLVVSTIREDDPYSIEKGVLVLSNLRYAMTDEEITNCILGQGSNNAFGVAVELRHSSLQRKFGYYSNVPFSQTAYPIFGRADEVRGAEIEEDSTNNTNFELGAGLGNPRASGSSPPPFENSPPVYTAFAKRVSFSSEFDFSWAAHYGYKQLYSTMIQAATTLRLDICPDSGGQPDTDNPILSVNASNFDNGFFGMVGVNDSVDDRPKLNLEVNPVTGQFEYVFDPGGDKINFSEVIWFANQKTGFERIPAGSYWFVVSLSDFGLKPWRPDIFATGLATWVAGAKKGGSSSLWYRNNTKEWESQPGFDPLFEVSGRYNTEQDKTFFPYIIEGQFADAIDDDKPTSGQRVFFIRDNDSIEEWGLRERVQSFQTAIDAREGVRDIEPSSNVLYASAVTYMSRRLDRFEELEFQVVGYFNLPKPGEKVRVVYRGLAETEQGAHKWVDIDALFWVLGIATSLQDDGIFHNFRVATVPENLLDPNAIPFAIMRTVHRHNDYLAELEFGSHPGIVRDDWG